MMYYYELYDDSKDYNFYFPFYDIIEKDQYYDNRDYEKYLNKLYYLKDHDDLINDNFFNVFYNFLE